METVNTKDKYTIGEVVERLQPEFPTLSVSKVRYLERRRLINLTRTKGGYRLFSEQDVELLKYILTLQDREYLPLKVIKKRIEGGAPIPAASHDSTEDLSRVFEDRTYTREELGRGTRNVFSVRRRPRLSGCRRAQRGTDAAGRRDRPHGVGDVQILHTASSSQGDHGRRRARSRHVQTDTQPGASRRRRATERPRLWARRATSPPWTPG